MYSKWCTQKNGHGVGLTLYEEKKRKKSFMKIQFGRIIKKKLVKSDLLKNPQTHNIPNYFLFTNIWTHAWQVIKIGGASGFTVNLTATKSITLIWICYEYFLKNTIFCLHNNPMYERTWYKRNAVLIFGASEDANWL